MSFFDKNLLPDEQIAYRTKKHFIIFLVPVAMTCFIFFFLFSGNEYMPRLAWIPAIAAVILWLNSWLIYTTSEFAITNKRILMKEGFFTRHTNETRLSAIANVSVYQTLLGQLLNYGAVNINAFGGETDSFLQIASPFEFQKQLQAQLDKLTTTQR